MVMSFVHVRSSPRINHDYDLGPTNVPVGLRGSQRGDGKLAPWMVNPELLPRVPPPMPGGSR